MVSYNSIMKPPRNITVDLLRGIAMISMMLIHTTYYFIGSSKIALFLWHWSQFAVPVFVFCSGYVFFLKPQRIHEEGLLNYMWKRVKRLVIPYYIFLIFFFPIIWFTTDKLTPMYILQSLFIIGGVDISWLVLLMLELSLLFPLLILLQRKKNILFLSYIALATLVAIITIPLPLSALHWKLGIENWKLIMWLGWSLMGIFSMVYINVSSLQKFLQNKLMLFIGATIVSIITYIYERSIHHDITLYGNKYPPTLLILSFGVAAIVLLYILAEKQCFKPIQKLLIFTSTHSYSLFFIHYCFLIALANLLPKLHTTWYFFFASVLGAALLVQYLWNRLKPLLT